MRRVQTALVSSQTAVDDHSLLIEVVERSPILRLSRATAECEIVVHGEGTVRDFLLPIRVRIAQSRHGRCAPEGVLPLRHEGPVLLAGRQAQSLARHGRADIGLVLDQRFTRTALRGDEDDAVGAAAAVNRRGRRVLEDRHRLDVVRTDRVERVARQSGIVADAGSIRRGRGALQRHAVDHVQRIVARADRGPAPDADLHVAARLAAARDDLDAGSAALNELRRIGDDTDLRVRGIDSRHGARDRLAPLSAVSGGDDLGQHRRLRHHVQLDVCRSAVGHRDRGKERVVSNASRPNPLRASWNAAEIERAVGPSERRARCPFDAHRDAAEGLMRP